MKRSLFTLIPLLLFGSISYGASSIPTAIYSEDTISEEINHKDWHFYKIEVDNPSKLTVKLRKISDDVDLYVAHSKKPTEDNFHCAPQKSGSSIETCRLTSNTAATWYIGVHGKMDSNYQLSVNTKDLKLLSQIDVK
ncbi:MAG: PPC domain-containing protein [Gammaproteobacteria bacterium]|nr:PPC domain-containing protein [Gammaproteobacteria bacterium]